MVKKLISFDDQKPGTGLPDQVTGSLDRRFQVSAAASPAVGASVTPTGSTPRVVGRIGDDLVGFDGGRIYLSPDETDWQDMAPTPQGAPVQIILPCEDGEVLCAIYRTLWRSVGWGSGAVTWEQKHAASGEAYFEPYCVNGRGGKFIASDYGDRTASRYVSISVDDGHTWTQVWDSDVDAAASTPDFSHVHGVEYDHYRDRFYISEGHGPAAGLYVSEDDGATWVKPPGLFMDPAPTTVNVTPDGLVCGSDSDRAGLLGVVAQDDPMNEKFVETWRWHKGRDGVIGFGVSGHTDPDTGVVYVAFRTAQDGVNPIIAGGTPTTGGLVWEYDGTGAVLLNDVKHALVREGRLYAWGTIAGQDVQIRGHVPPPGVPLLDTATARMEGTSLMLGHGATRGGVRTTAVGVTARATGAQDSTAVGYDAASSDDALAVGKSARATASSTAVGNRATTSSGGRQTAVGRDATTSGGDGTALGASASAASLSTAVGTTAVTMIYGVAVGRLANATTSGTAVGDSSTSADFGLAFGAGASAGSSSVALGAGAKTATGGRELAIGRQASTTAGDALAIGGAAQAAIFGVAVGTEAKAAAGATAIGRQATALHSRSVAIGRDVTASAPEQVAFGPRHMELGAIASAPSAPAAGKYRMWSAVDGTTGKMRLMVAFPTGTPIVIAQEA